MNEDKTQQQAAAPAANVATTAEAEKEPKSRGRVWLVVALLLIAGAFGWEALAFYGYQTSSQSIAEAMQRESGKPKVAEARDMLVGFPQESSDAGYSRQTQTYRWRGLLMEYGGVRLSIDPETQVVEVFEMGIPTREEEQLMQMEYEPLPGDTTSGAAGRGVTTPMSGGPGEPAAQPDSPPGEDDAP